MMSLRLPSGPLRVVAIGAHPDDVEIGCGGTLLSLAASRPLTVDVVVLTGSEERRAEAHKAAAVFCAQADRWRMHGTALPDGRLPAHWNEVKDLLEAVSQQWAADVVLAPRRDDQHQDHRLLGELVTTVWRDSLVLHYEIPKWDGDLRPVTHYVPLDDDTARRKVSLLDESYPSQHDRDWWDAETFLGLMRLRGLECRHRYAEGFIVRKATVGL